MSNFEEKVISLFAQTNKAIDDLSGRVDDLSGRMDGLSGRMDDLSGRMEEGFKSHDQRFELLESKLDKLHEDMNDEFCAVRVEMAHESKSIRDVVNGVDSRVQNLESVCSRRWDIPDISDRLSAVEIVVPKHSGQINRINKAFELPATN